jgi:hypothetical protein
MVINKDQQKNWCLDGHEYLRSFSPKATVNFWLDILLLGILLATVLTAFINPRLHIRSGMLLILIISIHLSLHSKLLESVLKGRVRLQWKWLLNIALLATFMSTVLSGAIVALIYAPTLSDFHRSSVGAFFTLVMIHLYTNRKWITGQFKRHLKSNKEQ